MPHTVSGSQPSAFDIFYAKQLIEGQQSRDLLDQHHTKLTMRRRRSGANDKLADAIWDGYWALKCQCERLAESARDDGVLLFAWEGTTVLRQEAA